jgi:hypothetical protein
MTQGVYILGRSGRFVAIRRLCSGEKKGTGINCDGGTMSWPFGGKSVRFSGPSLLVVVEALDPFFCARLRRKDSCAAPSMPIGSIPLVGLIWPIKGLYKTARPLC